MSDHIIEFNPAPANARDPSSTDMNNTSKVIIAEVSYLFIEIWFYVGDKISFDGVMTVYECRLHLYNFGTDVLQ
ncbi:hypothetical protein G6F33_013873 [Rhizopus arrhizus]|nr:hypothetical protein G6F24_014643 [Rhizopus arrhizus]KAG0893354.1 hypothetical protein G6F33_013873 [Rhizopus arrhizus]KAG0925335.1 hypothetical protein G6F32_013595 [Rhizopus arrhizus]